MLWFLIIISATGQPNMETPRGYRACEARGDYVRYSFPTSKVWCLGVKDGKAVRRIRIHGKTKAR